METRIFDDAFETVGSTFVTDDHKTGAPEGVEKHIDDTQSSTVKTLEENKTPENPEVITTTQEVKKDDVENKIVDPGEKTPEMIEFKENVILRRIGESLKEEGVEFEIPDNIDVKTFVNTLTSTIINKEVSDPESPIMKSIINRFAEENGVDETTLSIASGISYGIDRKEFSDLIELQNFSQIEVDPADEELVQDIFFTYHTLNGMDEKAAIEYTKIDLKNADIDLINARKQSIGEFAEKGLSNIEKTVNERKLLDKKHRDEKVEKINALYKSKTVAGHTFTKEEWDSYLKATSEKTEKIVYPNGVESTVTKFDKKRYEEGINNFENALLQNMLFWLDKKDLKESQKKDKNLTDTKGKFLDGLNNDLKESKISNRSVEYNKAKEVDDDVMVVASSF